MNAPFDPFSELGISEQNWQITVNSTKGALSGNRGVVVEVLNRRTGQSRRVSSVTKTKAQSRQVVASLVRELVDELR